MADLRADLAALRAKVGRMTPGEWRLDGPYGFCAVEADDLTANDAAGIVALRNAAPAYLAALARIAEIVGRHNSRVDYAGDALDEIRAVLAGMEKP